MKRLTNTKESKVVFLYFDFLINNLLTFGLFKAFIDDLILSYRKVIQNSITFHCPRCLSNHFWKNGHEKRIFGPVVQKFICPNCGKSFCENTFSPFYYYKYPIYLILASLKLKGDGKQISKIRSMLLLIYLLKGIKTYFMPCYHTITRWIKRFGQKVIDGCNKFQLRAGKRMHWEIDEEYDSRILKSKSGKYVRKGKKKVCTIGIIDPYTKLVYIESIRNQFSKKAESIFRRCMTRWNVKPRSVWRDGYDAYDRIFSKLGIPYGTVIHMKEYKSKKGYHTNNIEREWSNKRTWIKACRGYKKYNGHSFYNKFFEVQENFFRQREALKGMTPAQKAGVKDVISFLSVILRNTSKGVKNNNKGAFGTYHVPT